MDTSIPRTYMKELRSMLFDSGYTIVSKPYEDIIFAMSQEFKLDFPVVMSIRRKPCGDEMITLQMTVMTSAYSIYDLYRNYDNFEKFDAELSKFNRSHSYDLDKDCGRFEICQFAPDERETIRGNDEILCIGLLRDLKLSPKAGSDGYIRHKSIVGILNGMIATYNEHAAEVYEIYKSIYGDGSEKQIVIERIF